jgi:hypothetical protein
MTDLKRSNTMSDQEQKQDTTIIPQPDAEKKKESGELSEEQLKKAAGGVSFPYSQLGVKYQQQN